MPVQLNGCGSVSRTVRVESRVKSCLSSIALMRLRSAAIGPLDVLAFTAVTTGGHAVRHWISVLSAHVSPSFRNPQGRIVRSTVFSLVILAAEFPISALAALGCVALVSMLTPPRCTNLTVSSSLGLARGYTEMRATVFRRSGNMPSVPCPAVLLLRFSRARACSRHVSAKSSFSRGFYLAVFPVPVLSVPRYPFPLCPFDGQNFENVVGGRTLKR